MNILVTNSMLVILKHIKEMIHLFSRILDEYF